MGASRVVVISMHFVSLLSAAALFILSLLHTSFAASPLNVYFTASPSASPELKAFPRTVDKTAPLTSLLQYFFDGPRATEEAAGAERLQFRCMHYSVNGSLRARHCTARDIVKFVAIHQGVARIELAAYPNASASGIWALVDAPIAAIVRQFPHIKGWVFSMKGYRVGGDWGSACDGNVVCFIFSDLDPSDPRAEVLTNYGAEKLPSTVFLSNAQTALPPEVRKHISSIRDSCNELNPDFPLVDAMQGVAFISLSGDGSADILVDNRRLCAGEMRGANCSNRGCDLKIWKQTGTSSWELVFHEHLQETFISLDREAGRFQKMVVSIYAGDPRCQPAKQKHYTSGQSCDLTVTFRDGTFRWDVIR